MSHTISQHLTARANERRAQRISGMLARVTVAMAGVALALIAATICVWIVEALAVAHVTYGGAQ
ncbi:hypothetical protein GCM10016455_05810 [Aliiroseovarius zhejiangensis]|uniref:Phosphate ABC transporter permease subunit PstC n=1 Tax=Aliiroseovarius zhejiangensis TaxID=1632025 RepID=A0ABQ3ISC9_9RHOB|nr:hypothetical protein [Aliiroseovarius zhejiangensis]GHE88518.1 hypothetical protein GCM10016455_05810 [Aliiroseovarius zhejiangensis]